MEAVDLSFECVIEQDNREGLDLLKTAIAKAGYTDKVVIGMDVAASEFYNEKDKLYDLNFKEEVSESFCVPSLCKGVGDRCDQMRCLRGRCSGMFWITSRVIPTRSWMRHSYVSLPCTYATCTF